MTGTEQTRAVVRRYFETMSGREWDDFGALVTEDVVYEMPQTGERITGREKYVAFNREYPGDWRLTVTRLIADGATAAASMNFTVGEEELVGLVYLELRGELIARITDFLAGTVRSPGRPGASGRARRDRAGSPEPSLRVR
jgi:predicted ester cyclase